MALSKAEKDFVEQMLNEVEAELLIPYILMCRQLNIEPDRVAYRVARDEMSDFIGAMEDDV
jgi:hypothetical protein